MSSVLIAKVAVDHTAYHFDTAYDYLIPSDLQEKAVAGCRVLIPFGGGERKRQGMILEVVCESSFEKVKPIVAVLDKAPLLHTEMLRLAVWMKERYFCTLFDAIKTMLPAGLHYNVAASYTLARDIKPEILKNLSADEKRMTDYLAARRIPVRQDKLLTAMGLTSGNEMPDKLVKKGILIREDCTIRKVGDAVTRMVRAAEPENEFSLPKLAPKQQEVYSLLCTAGCVSVKEICYFTGATVSVINALVKKGLAQYFENEVYRNPYQDTVQPDGQENIVLSQEQQAAYDSLYRQYSSGTGSVSLLYGVTGSGKTSVFMKLIDKVHQEGRGVIIMVPEISLTPQMTALFRSRYGSSIAVFHSALSMGERLDEWKRVRSGEARIAIGTRSAVFAPFDDIGLIIMDEEQEYTYKSESAPRFHTRDIAKFRCREHNCLLVLCSATPSVESYYNAQKGRYALETLTKRYGAAKLPQVTICDMNVEAMEGNTGAFSSVLVEGLAENMQKGRQSILLLNRRGYNTFASCRACGEVLTCPHCSISMTYHAASGRLLCHYCGYSIRFTDECPNCHEKQMRYAGMGTQRAQQELEKLFPQARILRMDTDTTLEKFSHQKKLKQFAEGEYDIMIGTQMVAKGLDFPNVTLVGVLSADQTLYSDDFRSYERAFALLTQVVGRSGRGENAGRAVIQTFTPENPVIRMAAAQDYAAFYQSEIQMRRAMLYPPFADICVVGFVGTNQTNTEAAAKYFFAVLKDMAQKEYSNIPLRVIGPSSASIAKISNKYRYKIILKFKNDKYFREMLSRLLVCFGKQRAFADVTAFADVNPDIIM